MHLGLSTLLEFYRAHLADDALILGTVITTKGSTYRKPGAMMLIAADGSHRGLISGGCLESDLAQHAKQLFKNGEPRNVIYDLSSDEDLVWGLGIGCDGVIELMLQRLDSHQDFGFLGTLERAWQARRDGVLGLAIGGDHPEHPAGSFVLDCGEGFNAGDAKLFNSIRIPTEIHDMSRRFWFEDISTPQGKVKMLMVPVIPPPVLLVCGAGTDAVPVTRLAAEMGWNCIVVDHRSAFASAERFPDSCEVHLLQADKLASNIDLNHIDAVIIMSHNLDHDRQYLAQVIAARISYIGLLGPRARRDRLLSEINAANEADGLHVHGPAGLDIGAEMPESIALSIIAEIHAWLNRRTGSALTPSGT